MNLFLQYFWGRRADEMGAEDQGSMIRADGEGRGKQTPI